MLGGAFHAFGAAVSPNDLRTLHQNKLADEADAENASYALWSAAIGAVAAVGIWYLFLRSSRA